MVSSPSMPQSRLLPPLQKATITMSDWLQQSLSLYFKSFPTLLPDYSIAAAPQLRNHPWFPTASTMRFMFTNPAGKTLHDLTSTLPPVQSPLQTYRKTPGLPSMSMISHLPVFAHGIPSLGSLSLQTSTCPNNSRYHLWRPAPQR